MADEVLRIRVAEAIQQDVGQGIVRLGVQQMQALGLEEGGIVRIQGKRLTAAVVLANHPEDEGIEVVRMDGLIRGNARVGIGEFVELSLAGWKEAKTVLLAPAREGLRISGSGEGSSNR